MAFCLGRQDGNLDSSVGGDGDGGGMYSWEEQQSAGADYFSAIWEDLLLGPNILQLQLHIGQSPLKVIDLQSSFASKVH